MLLLGTEVSVDLPLVSWILWLLSAIPLGDMDYGTVMESSNKRLLMAIKSRFLITGWTLILGSFQDTILLSM